MSILDTGIKNVKNVDGYNIGSGSIESFQFLISQHKQDSNPIAVYIDEYFIGDKSLISKLSLSKNDLVKYVSSKNEPTTEYIDKLVNELKLSSIQPSIIVGIGGGTTLDIAKAISNLMTNNGPAKDYQGWDLLKNRGIFKVGIPTISGTGSETTRTCVMTNKENGLKLGMNSDYTVFDRIILDPDLTKSVPRNQYFWTGMDAYIHCVEALEGSYRNSIGDAYSHQTIELCRQVFNSKNMQSNENREKLMVASFLGGCSIATSYVGVVHPFSAGLSVVLGTHHCVANCIVMRGMEEFYPKYYNEFWGFVENQHVDIPSGICNNLSEEKFKALYEATIIHEKPLTNALGENFKEILSLEKVIEIFKLM